MGGAGCTEVADTYLASTAGKDELKKETLENIINVLKGQLTFLGGVVSFHF